MSYYLVFNFDVTDSDLYRLYVQEDVNFPWEKFNAKTLVNDYEANDIEGKSGQILVIYEFESQAEALAFYRSPEYKSIVGLRKNSTEGWVRGAPQYVTPAGYERS